MISEKRRLAIKAAMNRPDVKEKSRLAKLGKKRPDMQGDNNPAKRKEVGEKIRQSKLGKPRSEETKEKLRLANLGKKQSPETIAKRSKAMIGKNIKKPEDCKDEKVIHEKAFDLFGRSKCEECGMTLEEHIERYKCRLHMHNTLEPKDYKVMEQRAWQCLCSKCHTTLENTI